MMTADGDDGLLIAAWLAHERERAMRLVFPERIFPPMLDDKRQRHGPV